MARKFDATKMKIIRERIVNTSAWEAETVVQLYSYDGGRQSIRIVNRIGNNEYPVKAFPAEIIGDLCQIMIDITVGI